MASVWAKPGAWALDSEAHDAAESEKGYESSDSASAAAASAAAYQPPADFPSLSAAAATKPARKKKPQTVSLAEFTTGHSVSHGATRSSSFSKGLTSDELLSLPTGPRERSAEELERSGRGFGYLSSFGLGRGPARGTDDPRRSREPSRDMGPSRADEIDDWGAAKKFAPPSMPERRERSSGFFDNPSRADESDSWASKKSAPPPLEGRRVSSGFDAPRERRGGFEMFNREGVDSDTWGRKREEKRDETADTWGRKREEAPDTWGRKREEGNGGRPRLVLQPRTLPATNGNNGEHKEEQQQPPKSKGSNPFGEARPREEVLAQKGQDWKEIDEKLESMKIREAPLERKKRLGIEEDRTERAWRKADPAEAPPQRVENTEEEVPDN